MARPKTVSDDVVIAASPEQQQAGRVAATLIEVVRASVEEHEEEFGRIDALMKA